MERMSSYMSYEAVQAPEAEFKSFFERHTEIPEHELQRVRFSPETRQLEVPHSPEQAAEALWHPNSQTLIVPPPKGGETGVEALAKMSLPVVGFIDQIKPDVVIGCDRGGRLFSLATHNMWRNLHGKNERFPTIDEKLRFAHLSRRFGPEVFADLVEDILERTAAEQKHGQNNDKLRFLFIDDHVSTGATRRFAKESLTILGLGPEKAEMFFAISWGTKADVSGGKTQIKEPWQNKPKMIGVEYGKDHVGHPVRSAEAIQIRKDLHTAIKEEARNFRVRRIAQTIFKRTK
jgi:hypothetical protein